MSKNYIAFSRTSVSESPALDDSSGYSSVPQYPKDVHIDQVNECLYFLFLVKSFARFMALYKYSSRNQSYFV